MAKRRVLPSEAAGWAAFFAREEYETHTRADYAMAMIAREVHLLRHTVSILVNGFGDVKPLPDPITEIEDFLVRYGSGELKKVERPPMTPEEVAKKKKEVSERMSAIWRVRMGATKGAAKRRARPLPPAVVIATGKRREAKNVGVGKAGRKTRG